MTLNVDYKKEILNSDGHLKLVVNNLNDNKLMIIFGAADHFNKMYLLENQIQFLSKNVLFFNSERNDWFVEGQSFLDERSVELSSLKLKGIIDAICQEYSFTELLFLGHSMGAYGVLIYTQLMQFSIKQNIIASCPKIDLEISSIRRVYKVSPLNKYKNQRGLTVSLNELDDLSLKKYFFIYGEKDLLDTSCVLEYQRNFQSFQKVEIEVKSFMDSGHYLLNSFKSIGFSLSIEQLLDCNFNEIIGQGNLHNKLSLEDIQGLMRIHRDDREYYFRLFFLLEKYPNFFIALNRIGVENIKLGKSHLGLQYLQRAYRISPSDLNTNIHLAKCYFTMKKYSASLMHYSFCLVNSKKESKDNYMQKINELTFKINSI